MSCELSRIFDGELRSAPGMASLGEILGGLIPPLARAAGRSVPIPVEPVQGELFPRTGCPHWLSERPYIQ